MGYADVDDEPAWQPNYSSAKDKADLVEVQFREEEAEGLMTRMSLKDGLTTS